MMPAQIHRHRVRVFIAAIALSLACSSDLPGGESGTDDGDVDYEGPWETFEERPCPPDSTVDGLSFGAPFLLTWCNGCHGADVPKEERQGAPLGLSFDSLDDVREHDARIWLRAGDHNETMPPTPGPSLGERRMLGEWLACGAPFSLQ